MTVLYRILDTGTSKTQNWCKKNAHKSIVCTNKCSYNKDVMTRKKKELLRLISEQLDGMDESTLRIVLVFLKTL